MGILISDLVPSAFLEDSRLFADIQNQPASLSEVSTYYCKEGEGAATQASDLIQFADKVVITAMGASLYAAVGFQSELKRAGLNVTLEETGEFLYYQDSLPPDTLVMIVSRSGETIEIVKAAKKVREQQASLIAVTNNPSSSLATVADLVLPVPSQPDGDMAIQSYTATVLTLTLLASRIRGDLSQTGRALEPLVLGLGGFLERMIKDVPRWDCFLDPHLPVHFLGRGPSLGSALEACMLWNETAKQTAVAVTAGNFRHGHIEVVDSRFRAVIFAPDGPTKELNLGLAEAITRFGGSALVIGTKNTKSGDTLWIDTLSLPETLAPLVEILPVQIAAARLAAIKGLPVGALRHAQSITRDEIGF